MVSNVRARRSVLCVFAMSSHAEPAPDPSTETRKRHVHPRPGSYFSGTTAKSSTRLDLPDPSSATFRTHVSTASLLIHAARWGSSGSLGNANKTKLRSRT